MDDGQLTTLVSSYITQRDAMRTAQANGASSQQSKFLDLINGHGAKLAQLMPTMNLAEWEGLTELCGSHLNELRRKIDADRLKF